MSNGLADKIPAFHMLALWVLLFCYALIMGYLFQRGGAVISDSPLSGSLAQPKP